MIKRSPSFGMIANFAAKKSHDVFFAAAMKVLEEAPEVIFLLVGGGDRSRYEALVKDRGLDKNFIFTGFRSDIPRVIAGLDFSLISSGKGEGLTGSLVESMAMAKPVISTDVGANAEFVKAAGYRSSCRSRQSRAACRSNALSAAQQGRSSGNGAAGVCLCEGQGGQ